MTNKPKTRAAAAMLLAAAVSLAACGSEPSAAPLATDQRTTAATSATTETVPAESADQVEQVVALLKSIENGDPAPAAAINPEEYIQHNLNVADGIEGFGEVLSQLPEGSANVNVVRAFTDGDFVFTHTEYDFFGPKIGFDIFRFEDGLIVEHWDNLQTTPTKPNPSGRTMIDGSAEVTDIDLTDQNTELVERFVQQILIDGDTEALPEFFDGDTYIQHNPAIGDGVSGLGAALAELSDQGLDIIYEETHMVLGEGNFVLVASEGTFGGEPTAFYDLFRVEDGFIAEHWDVIETIIPESERKNTNGKF